MQSISGIHFFQVKVTDMGGIVTGSSGGALRGSQALRFFQTHQIRVCFFTRLTSAVYFPIKKNFLSL